MIISIDDYHKDNIKLARMIKRYGFVKNTIFFIECGGWETQKQIKELSKMGFEIGSHTLNHTFLTEVPEEEALIEIEASKLTIESLTGRECEAFCYPRGRYNKRIIKMVKNAGYKWARTTKLDDRGQFERAGVHLSYPRKEYDGKDPFDVARESKLGHYWGHVSELLKFNKMKEFEDFLRWLKKEK